MNRIDLRLLGLVTLVGAPAMFVEAARHGFQKVPNEDTDLVGALLYGLFSVGWLCAMLGLRRLRAAGRGKAGLALMNVVVVTVTLAVLQSLMDALKVPTTHPLYVVTDLAWPLSMLLTLVVGVAAIFARTLPGWQRFAPFFVGVSVPVALVFMALGVEVPLHLLDLHTVVGWALLGFVLFSNAAPARDVAFASAD